MALIKCKECKKEISDKAKFCPNCGNPNVVENEPKKEIKEEKGMFITSGICSGISLIINPLGILSILGIIFGIISICIEKKNRGWAITSVIIGILATLITYAQLAQSMKTLF